MCPLLGACPEWAPNPQEWEPCSMCRTGTKASTPLENRSGRSPRHDKETRTGAGVELEKIDLEYETNTMKK